MPDLSELRPGAYRSMENGGLFDPTPTAPGESFASTFSGATRTSDQGFRGNLNEGDVKIITPVSMFSGKFYPQKFKSTAGKAALAPGKFKKGPLGDYETEDTSGILQPSEKLFPPQKRILPRNEKIEDAIGQLLVGAGRGAAEIGGFPRTVGDAINTALDRSIIPENFLHMLPTKEQIAKGAMANQRFFPLSPEVFRRAQEGPLSPGGEYSGAMGEYIPYSVGGTIPGVARLISKLYRIQSLLP